MANGVRFGQHIEETRIVIADIVPRKLSYVLFVDDEQKDFDYLYEAWMPLFPSQFNTGDSSEDLLERVAKMDGYKHPVERIRIEEDFNVESMQSKRGAPYTKEMLVALFGESQRNCKR